MQKNPSCATCTDGIISIEVNGPLRPFEFRIKKIAPTAGAWSAWSATDTFNGRVKTFTGLGVGVYQIDIDTDNSYATQDCVTTKTIELINGDPCAADCDSTEGKCENALEYIAKGGTLSLSNMPEQVYFSHIPEYEVGEAELTVEMWLKPDVIGNNMLLWDWNTNMSPFFSPGPAAIAGDEGGITLRVTNFGVGQEFSLGINCNKHTTNDYLTGNGFKCYTAQVPNIDYSAFNHIVFILRNIPITAVGDVGSAGPDPTVGALAVAANQIPAFEACFEFWVNGIRVMGVQGNTMNGADPKSNLSDTERDFLRNFNNLNGGVRLNTRTSHMEFPSANTMTNFRQYARALSGKEIQKNYLAGCKADPYNCSQLMIWAPLNQTTGAITQDRAHGNNGQLIGFAINRYNQIGGTSAWVQACCPKIADFDDYTCGSQDCNPDYVEYTFKLTGLVTAAAQIIAFVPFLDSCPIPSNVIAAAVLEGVPLIVDISAAPNLVDMADLLADTINGTVGFQTLGIKAFPNLNTVTVRMPINTYSGTHCGKPFSVCMYSGTTGAPVTYAGAVVIEYPRGKNGICCVSDDACSTEEVIITV